MCATPSNVRSHERRGSTGALYMSQGQSNGLGCRGWCPWGVDSLVVGAISCTMQVPLWKAWGGGGRGPEGAWSGGCAAGSLRAVHGIGATPPWRESRTGVTWGRAPIVIGVCAGMIRGAGPLVVL